MNKASVLRAVRYFQEGMDRCPEIDFSLFFDFLKTIKVSGKTNKTQMQATNFIIELHETQYLPAAYIASLLENSVKLVLYAADPQVGKTGMVQALGLIKKMIESSNRKSPLRTKKIYFVSPIPLKQNRNQDIRRLLGTGVEYLHKHKEKKSPKLRDHSILVIDESHWGMKEGDNVAEIERLWINNPTCQIVYLSATPFPQVFSEEFMEAAHVVKLPHKLIRENGYYGYEEMLDRDQIVDTQGESPVVRVPILNKRGKATDSKLEINSKFEEALDSFANQFDKSVFLVRVSNEAKTQVVVDYISHYISETRKHISIIQCNMNGHDISYLDKEQLKKINRHTVILVKGYCRIGYTIEDISNISAIWESGADNIATVVQGLPGRICGYRGKTSSGLTIYMNKEIAENYKRYSERGSVSELTKKPHALIRHKGKSSSMFSMDITQIVIRFVGRLRGPMTESYSRAVKDFIKKYGVAVEGFGLYKPKLPLVTSATKNEAVAELFAGKRSTVTGAHRNPIIQNGKVVGHRASEDMTVSINDSGKFQVLAFIPKELLGMNKTSFKTSEISAHSGEALRKHKTSLKLVSSQ